MAEWDKKFAAESTAEAEEATEAERAADPSGCGIAAQIMVHVSCSLSFTVCSRRRSSNNLHG